MNTVTQTMQFRQSLLKYAEKYGVTKAAIKYNVNRQYIYRWKRRYNGDIQSLANKSHRPHHHPNSGRCGNSSETTYRRESFLCMGGDRLLAPCIQRTMGKSLHLPFFHKVLGRIAFITYPCRKRVGLLYGFNKPCWHVGIVDTVPGAKAHKKPRRQRECRQGLIMSKISREKDDQSSLLSSRLPSFLACSTTAGTSMSGRIS